MVNITRATSTSQQNLRKEEKKIDAMQEAAESMADIEFEADLIADVEDVKRSKGKIKKEEAIKRANKRRKTRSKVYNDTFFAKRKKSEETDRNMGGTMKKYNMGGTMKNYRAGGIEAADKEGSRLSISMERQEDAGYSPSEADFDQQNRLAAEGIMEVGADVKIIQGHNSRASLGETEGVRGTGAMVKGTKFRGSF
jgi:hypothetical protein